MKILVYIPTTQRMVLQTIDRVMKQTGSDERYFDVVISRDNPYDSTYGEVYKNVQLNYEKMRQLAISGGYQKVWVVEEDIIPPFDALSKMLSTDAQIVTGLYAMRHGAEPTSNLYSRNENSPSLGHNLSWKEVTKQWGMSIAVGGGCMGCLLIDAEVLKDFSFILEGNNNAPDVPFMQYAWDKKITTIARLDVVCGHAKSNGQILYPDRERGWRSEAA